MQRVRPEIQQVSAILLGHGAAPQVLRLLQKHYFAALACQRIGGGESGQAASDDDISLHWFPPCVVPPVGRGRRPVCDSHLVS